MVAYGLVDGAAVDGLIWQYVNRKNPKLTSETKIIAQSEPYGIPPLVVSRKIDKALKIKLRDLMLNLHNDPKGAKILKEIFIDKFVPADDSSYNSIRKMCQLAKSTK
jgi:phosphonate transport system substrate-binding protein